MDGSGQTAASKDAIVVGVAMTASDAASATVLASTVQIDQPVAGVAAAAGPAPTRVKGNQRRCATLVATLLLFGALAAAIVVFVVPNAPSKAPASTGLRTSTAAAPMASCSLGLSGCITDAINNCVPMWSRRQYAACGTLYMSTATDYASADPRLASEGPVGRPRGTSPSSAAPAGSPPTPGGSLPLS